MKYIQFDAEGNLFTRYDSDIHEVIPQVAVQVSDDIFWRSISETDGLWVLQGGEVVKVSLPPPTPEEVAAATLERNTAKYNDEMKAANHAVVALQDKVDADLATSGETATLKLWKAHRVALRELDLTKEDITWPARPE